MTGPLTILGGGPAGLAVGHYAARRKIRFTIIEAAATAGGNCRTLSHGGFRFDTGAHRFHDKLPDVTADMTTLLGSKLRHVDVPSQIFYDGKFLDFPLAPLNVLGRLGTPDAARAIASFLRDRRPGTKPRTFADFAIGTYGRFLAERFLLSYSEKLWGVPADQLLPTVSGGRLSGLTLRNALIETLTRHTVKSRHLDGSFYYPATGIGAITGALAESLPDGALQLEARVTAIHGAAGRIAEIEVNGAQSIVPDTVVSTLPIDLLTRLLLPAQGTPATPSLRYRHVVLVVLCLDVPRVTEGATVYFPEPHFPFTRAAEPKNRSPDMAPANQTCLAIEWPCFDDDAVWSDDSGRIAAHTAALLSDAGIIRADQVIDHVCHRLPRAYPVLDIGSAEIVAGLTEALARFENLRLIGRNSLFSYIHVHDLMGQAKRLVDGLMTDGARTSQSK